MYELNLLCPEARIEDLSDALEALDAVSVSVEDADAQTEHEQALFGEPGMPPPKEGWQRSRLLPCLPKKKTPKKRQFCWRLKTFLNRVKSCQLRLCPIKIGSGSRSLNLPRSKSHLNFGLCPHGMSHQRKRNKSFG